VAAKKEASRKGINKFASVPIKLGRSSKKIIGKR
jgi:hypothetical protein